MIFTPDSKQRILVGITLGVVLGVGGWAATLGRDTIRGWFSPLRPSGYVVTLSKADIDMSVLPSDGPAVYLSHASIVFQRHNPKSGWPVFGAKANFDAPSYPSMDPKFAVNHRGAVSTSALKEVDAAWDRQDFRRLLVLNDQEDLDNDVKFDFSVEFSGSCYATLERRGESLGPIRELGLANIIKIYELKDDDCPDIRGTVHLNFVAVVPASFE